MSAAPHAIAVVGAFLLPSRIVRFFVCSDLHLEREAYPHALPDCDVVLCAGDVHTKGRGPTALAELAAGRPAVMVPGNHDTWGEDVPGTYQKMATAGAPRGVQVLQARQVTLGRVRILGATLWTDFAIQGDAPGAMQRAADKRSGASYMQDYFKTTVRQPGGRYVKMRPIDTVLMHRAAVTWLTSALAEPHDGPTIVMTHHAPSLLGVAPHERPDPLTPGYASALDALVAASGAAVWIHGHTHYAHDTMIGATRLLANPLGYGAAHEPHNRFDPGLVLDLG